MDSKLNYPSVTIITDTDKIDKSYFALLLNFISNERQLKITKFLKWQDKCNSLISELLVRRKIIESLGIKNDEIQFYYNELDKPFLRGYQDFHFNISHTSNWAGCAFHNLPIGFDLEEIRPIPMDTSKEFMSDEELYELSILPQDEKYQYLYSIWTLKESYLKYLGSGFTHNITENVSFINNGNYYSLKDNRNTENNLKFKTLTFERNIKCSVCITDNSESSIFKLAIEWINLNALILSFTEPL